MDVTYYTTFVDLIFFVCEIDVRQEMSASPPSVASVYQFVLILAGIELMFFVVARMGLCFGFTVLVIQRCFSYC